MVKHDAEWNVAAAAVVAEWAAIPSPTLKAWSHPVALRYGDKWEFWVMGDLLARPEGLDEEIDLV